MSDLLSGSNVVKGNNNLSRRALIVSRVWIQLAIVVFIFGFFVLGYLGMKTYQDKPPIPNEVVDSDGNTLFTGKEIIAGQEVFLKHGLMEYGSIFGHGGYLGPDYTADYLRRSVLIVRDLYGGASSDRAIQQTIRDFKNNLFQSSASRLTYTQPQARAFKQLQQYYAGFFGNPTTKYGLLPQAIKDSSEIKQLTAYFSWSAWAASALRPGRDYSYTNNWPPETLVNNRPTAGVVLWSVLSLITLLGGIGIMLAVFGRWQFLGWHGRETLTLEFNNPGDVALTPAQRLTAYYFLVMVILFLAQSLLGGSLQHYRTELTNFFGIDLARILTFNLARIWHLQIAIFWISTSYLAAGIFISPLIASSEPRGQSWLAFALLTALAVVVFGSLFGEFAGIHGWITQKTLWFGLQGWEYLDLGRFWQILLIIGLFFGVIIVFRVLKGRLKTKNRFNLPWIFFYSAPAIPAFYAAGLLAHPAINYTISDYWRWWVVHLWVEDFSELFTTVVVAYVFVFGSPAITCYG